MDGILFPAVVRRTSLIIGGSNRDVREGATSTKAVPWSPLQYLIM